MDLAKIVNDTARKSLDNKSAGDYTDGEGFLVCGKCHTRKQHDVKLMGVLRRVGIICECRKAELAAEDSELAKIRQKRRIEQARREGLTDTGYYSCTFDSDDRRRQDISDACRKYVDDWEDMRKNNVGILFHGDVGTGKSFYACCIANALLDKGVSALVTSLPRIIAKIQSGRGDDLPWILRMIESCGIVVIDDLGVERKTEYAMEQIFNVIDVRSTSKKPLIVTTNMKPADFTSADTAHRRIYDRILQNSIKIKMAGPSRRSEESVQTHIKYAKKIGLE